ncbi:MAG: sulfurtransferase [Tatlockia sp.]|nr:sulfurtransferase [Tatlockia sp.]
MKQHSPQFLKLVNKAKESINEITSQMLKKKIEQQESFFLIDVREESEWAGGHIATAIHLGKGIIERDIEKTITDPESQIVIYCSGGFRSALVANSLGKMGYTQVYSLQTGSQGWLDAGYGLIK